MEIVRVGDGCEILVDEAIDSADKNDGWVIIQDLHLAPPKFFNNLKKHLIRVARSRSKFSTVDTIKDDICRSILYLL